MCRWSAECVFFNYISCNEFDVPWIWIQPPLLFTHVDYCNDLLAGTLKIWTDKLQKDPECYRAHGNKNQEVCPMLNTHSIQRITLAGYLRSCHIQTVFSGLQVSSQNLTILSLGPLQIASTHLKGIIIWDQQHAVSIVAIVVWVL